MTKEQRKEYLLSFGQKVRMYREAKGMTQEELAVKVGYIAGKNPSGSISKIERGCMEIGQSKIAEIARVLEIEPYQLFTDDQTARLVAYAKEITKMELSGKRDKGNLAKAMEQQNEIPVLKKATE